MTCGRMWRSSTVVCVLLAACSSWVVGNNCSAADVALWEQSGFTTLEEDLKDCYSDGVGNPETTETCVRREFPPYTSPCQECFVDVIVCAFRRCSSECIIALVADPSSKECEACTSEKCNPDFNICAGFPLTTCDTCIIPEEPSDDALPVIIGSVVGTVGLLLAAILLFYRHSRKNKGTPEEKLEKRLATLGIAEISTTPKSASPFQDKLRELSPDISSASSGHRLSGPDLIHKGNASVPPDTPEF